MDDQEEWFGPGMCHIWGRFEKHTEFWWGNLKEREHFKDTGIDGRIILTLISKLWVMGAWTWFICLMIGTGGGLLWVMWWTFAFHKTRGISWVCEDLLASQERLCPMELFTYLLILLSIKTFELFQRNFKPQYITYLFIQRCVMRVSVSCESSLYHIVPGTLLNY